MDAVPGLLSRVPPLQPQQPAPHPRTGPQASHVAGYRTWQALNRQVRKGERGIRILGGREIRETVENPKTGQEEEQRRTRFFPVSVFDIAQTDLIDQEAGDPADIARPLTGDDSAGIFDAVADYLTGKGWSVERENITSGANGYTDPQTRRVAVEVSLSPAQAAKTALHEAAHVLLHADEDPAEYVTHRGMKETGAESVAYVVAGILGPDTSAYSVGYVAGWSHCDAQTIKATAANVLRTAHTLADALTGRSPESGRIGTTVPRCHGSVSYTVDGRPSDAHQNPGGHESEHATTGVERAP